jgi:NAD+ synthase (glutamine-hydrolysing)
LNRFCFLGSLPFFYLVLGLALMLLTICVAQLNYLVGDMAGNARQIIEAARTAYARGARLLLTPELSICAYAAEDLFLRPSFIVACDAAVDEVRLALADLPDLHVVVGHPVGGDGVRDQSLAVPQRFNRASVLCAGRVVATYDKRELPNYQVFDERRYFCAGTHSTVFSVLGVKVGLLICEDAWFDAPVRDTAANGAQLLAVLNASPFHQGKSQEREQRMAKRCRSVGLPLVYAHWAGGQDELVFDGQSFALQADGQLAGRAVAFEAALFEVQMQASVGTTVGLGGHLSALTAPALTEDEALWRALVLGVRDYVNKNGFPSTLLGLSGGIDSALVLAIAVDALGADRVRTVMMPSPYTADMSWIDARDMAERLGVRYDEISISPEFETFKASLSPYFAGLAEDATEENIQARIRGTLLMALSNKTGAMVLTTGNKSEMATGYCTLYGDMAGGFAVIKDVLKTTVFRLARWRNANDPFGTGASPIPDRIIARPPSAELRPDQKDQDSLPPYEVLDAILIRHMENDESTDAIVAAGFERADVERVTKLIKLNEHKRRQSPVGIRVSHRSFGKDWRYPMTHRFKA